MVGDQDGASFGGDELERAISAVVGVSLMIVLVVLLASTIVGFAMTFEDRLREPEFGTETETENVNPWSDPDALLTTEDPTAGAEDVRYRLQFEIEDENMDGESLSEISIAVTTDDEMFTGITQDNVEEFTVERTDGSELDLSDDVDGWSTESDGSELKTELSGSPYTNASTGDVITIVFGSVDNPNSPGTYDVTVGLNEGDEEQDGDLEIVDETKSLRARPV